MTDVYASLRHASSNGSRRHRGLLSTILEPRSVAVIGASRKPGSVGNELFRNLFRGQFTGAIYPVNLHAGNVAGVQAYAHIGDVPESVELAIVCVPAIEVVGVAKECADAGVKALVVISAGFAESGEEGRDRQRELVDVVRAAGMRLVGPNCLGVLNTDPAISLAATFASGFPPVGNIGLMTQSGAVAIGVVEECRKLKLGLSGFVSVGNKADVSGNDLLEQWGGDARTDVILLYLESFGNPRRFRKLARGIARTKAIIALKSGRTAVGGKAASSHSAALASDDITVDALFRQAGVIRVDTVRQMLDVSRLYVENQVPKGRRVAIVGNSGGPGVMTADACSAYGLEIPELTEATQHQLEMLLLAGSSVHNPVDMTASATAAQYERAIDCVLADPNIDSVIAIFTPLPPNRSEVVANAIGGAAMRSGKPVITNFVAVDDAAESALRARHIVNYDTPEEAVFALAKAAGLSEWRRTSKDDLPILDNINEQAAKDLVERSLSERPDGVWLDANRAGDLLQSYGVNVVRSERASGVEEAVACAAAMGWPVVLKVADRQLLHKTEVGGVKLDLRNVNDVRRAFAEMQSSLGEHFNDVIVQPMVACGVELIVGAIEDPLFGPIVIVGLGGVNTEVLGDRAAMLTPLSTDDAKKLVRSLRAAPLLFGYRGAPSVDIQALEDVVCRIAKLVEDVPDIAELDCNPVIATPNGVVAVDVKVRLHRS